MPDSKIKSLTDLGKILAAEKKRGKKIVALSGVFDLLHPSHIEFLEKAKRLGDKLVVFLNNDSYVKAAKGNGRPIYDERARARMLAALEAVDFVLIFKEKTCLGLLRKLRPQIFVQGQDWGLNCIERPVMEKLGGEVTVIKVSRKFTTTKIINKIKNLGGK